VKTLDRRWRPGVLGLALALAAISGACGRARRSEIAEIVALEDCRSVGGGRLVALLGSPSNGVRARAARAAGRIADPSLLPALTSLLHDSDRSVIREAALAMGRVAERHELVREQATDSLVACLDAQGSMLGSAHDDVVEAIGRAGGRRARRPLLETLRQPRLGARAAAAWGLGQIGVAPDDSLLALALDDLSPAVRKAAAGALAGTQHQFALRSLFARLDDPEVEVRRAILRALAQSGAPGALEAIADRLSGREWDGPVQATALVGLEALGRPEDAPVLAQTIHPYVSSPSPLVRRTAARALRKLGPSAPLDDLLSLSRDAIGTVRAEAATALGALATERARVRLLELARDASPGVRLAALRTLVTSHALPDSLAAHPERDAILRAALIGGSAEARPSCRALEQALSDSAEIVVEAAIGAFREWAEADAVGFREAWSDVGMDCREKLGSFVRPAGSPEMKLSVLRVLRVLPADGHCVLDRWFRDPCLAVRVAAAAEARRLGCEVPTMRALHTLERPIGGAAPYPQMETLPQRAEVATTRGTFILALLGSEAPRTVAAFASLARAGAFRDLTFPVIEPDSVMVVGRPLGTPDPPVLDLRAEGNAVPMGRGKVATRAIDEEAPRLGFVIGLTDRPDLSASTVFAVVVHGGAVLDILDTEDRILSVTTR